MDDDALATLVSLLRLSQPLAKNQLQRLFLNLCWHPDTRKATLRILLSLLRAPPSAGAGAARGATGEAPDIPRSLTDALQVSSWSATPLTCARSHHAYLFTNSLSSACI